MKIAFISCFRENNGEGPGRIGHEIAEVFAQTDEILLIQIGEKNQKIDSLHSHMQIVEIQSLGQGKFAVPFLNPANVLFIYNELTKFAPDVIHTHDPDPISQIVQIWAITKNVPFFNTAHVIPSRIADFGAKEWKKYLELFFKNPVLQNNFHNFYENCDGIITFNESLKTICQKDFPHNRIYIIPNGRNLNYYHLPKELKTAKYQSKKLMFTGIMGERKNQIYLVEVMKYLPPEYELTLIGDFLSSQFQNRIYSLITKNQLTNVHITNGIPHKQIPNYLHQAKCFVSASTLELQSLAVLEALSSGTPVIGLANETINEFVDQTVGANLPANTKPAEFAKRIQSICELPEEKYWQLSQKAVNRVKNLDWPIIRERTRKAYQDTIEAKKAEEDKKRINRIRKTLSFIKDFQIKEYIEKYTYKYLKTSTKSADLTTPVETLPSINPPRKHIKSSSVYFVLIIILSAGISGIYYLLNSFKKLKSPSN